VVARFMEIPECKITTGGTRRSIAERIAIAADGKVECGVCTRDIKDISCARYL